VSPNKYSLKIAINKKWLQNQNDLEEDKYESPTFVYFNETNAMVPLVRVGLRLHQKCKDLGVTTPKHRKLW
jgi:hypothetical protein